MKNQRGVTLIALVVTIIVLIIIAGISIAALLGDNGVITRSKLAKRNQIEGEVRDKINLAIQAVKMEAEQKSATSENSFFISTDITDGTVISGLLAKELTPVAAAAGDNGYHVALSANTILITYSSADYKQATNSDSAKIECKLSVNNNNLTYATWGDNNSGWQYTPAIDE